MRQDTGAPVTAAAGPKLRHLIPVQDEPATPLTHDELRDLFQERWAAARQAYGNAQSALGALATPLFRQSPVTRNRVDAATHDVERAVTALREITASLAAIRGAFDRAEPPPTPAVRYRRVK